MARSISVKAKIGAEFYSVGWLNANNKCELGEKAANAFISNLADLKLSGKLLNNLTGEYEPVEFDIVIYDKSEESRDSKAAALAVLGLGISDTEAKSEPSPF